MSVKTSGSTFHTFKAELINGREISLQEFSGKVVLVVNVASQCGFTPQYEGLERLYEQYKEQGFTILGFPCNQFGGQEPGSESDIMDGCITNYSLTFPMFSKVNVNGKNAHPLFNYLKKSLPGFLGGRIKWNFTKFLVDQHGTPVKRFGSADTPESIEPYVRKLLAES